MKYDQEEKRYRWLSSGITVLLALLYFYKGTQDGMTAGAYICIGANILYAPLVLLYRERGFFIFNVGYGLAFIFMAAIYPAYLFNNYSALFFLSLVIFYRPKYKYSLYALYYIAVTAAFIINQEALPEFLIHAARSAWFILTLNFMLKRGNKPATLELTADERAILQELAAGKQQKELDLFSKNTITKKLKDARERNNATSNDELITRFKMNQDSIPVDW